MKNTVFAAICIIVLVLSSNAFGFSLAPDCAYVYGKYTGFDYQGNRLFLASVFAPATSSAWATADWEAVEGQDTPGDGIPDNYQLAMLGAALCHGDGALETQFQMNLALYDSFLENYLELLKWGSGPRTSIIAFRSSLLAWANGLSDEPLKQNTLDICTRIRKCLKCIPLTDATLPAIYEALDDMKAVRTWIVGMAGLSQGMEDAIIEFLGILPDWYTDWNVLAADISALPATAGALMDSNLADLCSSVATLLQDGSALNEAARVPDYTTYTIDNKTADEPFSATGDFDGDGVTNLETYGQIVAAGLGRDAFVEQATGGPTPQQVPVSNGGGMLALCAAISTCAAYVLRCHSAR